MSDKLERLRARAADLRRNIAEVIGEQDILGEGEEKVGTGYNNVILANGTVEVHNEDPAIGMLLTPVESELKIGTSLRMSPDVSRVQYNGRSFNPQVKYRPPNIVSYYPVVITIPCSITGRLLIGAANVILGMLRGDEDAG